MSEKQNGSIEPWLLYKTAKETPDRKSPAFPDQMCLKKFFTKAEMTGKAFFRHILRRNEGWKKRVSNLQKIIFLLIIKTRGRTKSKNIYSAISNSSMIRFS